MCKYTNIKDTAGQSATQDQPMQSVTSKLSKYLTSDEGEAHGKLWGDLGDDVGGEVAGGEGGLAHQVEDRVGHLDQLAGGEI